LFDDGFISARLEEGRLVVAVDDFRDNGGYSTLGLSFSDFVLDLEATKLGGSDDNGIFVVFAQTDTRNYNRFDISSDGFYALSEVRDGIARTVSEFRISTAINRGDAANQLRVIGIGGTYQFLVNGQTLEFCISSNPALQPLWETPLDPTSACLGGEIGDRWTRTDILAGKIGLGAQGFTGFDGENDTPAQAIIGFDNVRVLTPAAAGVQ
jgi:hypothetical protein